VLLPSLLGRYSSERECELLTEEQAIEKVGAAPSVLGANAAVWCSVPTKGMCDFVWLHGIPCR
jgi:hypothetical protein